MYNNARLSRFGRLAVVLGCLFLTLCALFVSRPYLPDEVQRQLQIPNSRPWGEQQISSEKVECIGPRGRRMDDLLTEDIPRESYRLDDAHEEYPIPTYGSYDDIALDKTWLTFDQRYGPYGYREEESGYNFTKVDWLSVDWGQLQDQCLLSQADRTHGNQFLQAGAPPKFRFADKPEGLEEPTTSKTGRHAIVLRTWGTYDYKPEDLWNIRSIITEASLATQGQFTVFLLVDIKRPGGEKIHEDYKFYRQVLEETVPKEFWNIAVLFHKSLQKSWYEKVNNFEPIMQIMQPLQLFAHFYRDFDTYWQVEMDTRFTGHVGEIARAFHKFGRAQSYKQARERASWTFIKQRHGSYRELAAGVNTALEGGATVWGPIDNGVSGWKPVGSNPPVSDPKDEQFQYGVDEDADLLVFSPISDVLRIQTDRDWPYKDWHAGVGDDIPRFLSFPAQAWASRTLLEAVHSDQHNFGIRVHSEATLPTFALWHGLKVVQVPMPKFQFPERDLEELDLIYNGGDPTKFEDGIAYGPAPYRSGAIRFFARPRTFEWQSSLNEPVWTHWMNEGDGEQRRLEGRARSNQAPIPDELPGFMREVEGEVYMPPFMMHPRKTNKNR